MYQVQTWDDKNKCTRYHDVTDAIDHNDAKDYIQHLHPEEKVLAIIHTLDDKEYEQ